MMFTTLLHAASATTLTAFNIRNALLPNIGLMNIKLQVQLLIN